MRIFKAMRTEVNNAVVYRKPRIRKFLAKIILLKSFTQAKSFALND